MDIHRRLAYSRWAFWACLVGVLVVALLPPRMGMPPIGWDKVGHAFLFSLLAMLGCWSYPQRTAPLLLGLLAYGGLIELLQSLTSYRTAESLDVVADGVGLLIGWQFMRIRRKELP